MTTTKNNEDKKLNVPNLRFPEFQGEWEELGLSELLDFKNGLNPKLDKFGKGIKFISVMDILNNAVITYDCIKASVDVTEKELSDFSVEKGDILFQRSSETLEDVGRANIYMDDKTAVFGGFVIRGKKKGEYDPQYFNYLLRSPFARKRIIPMGAGAQHFNIGQEGLSKVKLHFANIEEQKKIGKMLSLLDERISTQNKIIEDLKKLKSAIVEKVFCSPNQEYPMCRIEGFEQALSTYKMSDFSSRIATKNKDSKCSLVLTIAAQYGLVNQESFFNKSVASENLTGYYLLHKGEFAYNRSYSAGYDWGTVKRLDNYDEGVLSTLYICFKINETIVDSDYLAYYFESTKWHRGLSDIAGEGARNHGLLNVSMADYFNTKHRFPVIEEQKAIAKILNAITEKERKATLLVECYQKQKQYLLCQMFT
ncbi:restriction endonuclease subunit S [uncultured Prevotella sp.]|uniref:restriction endonuclease subunit S n=1 Tax=uncultured Prevotella sp. TaxID=159272 RepID=UPI0027E2CF1D|nr:restriction endonuclease subunit S [uncultured Prevotella sp.]